MTKREEELQMHVGRVVKEVYVEPISEAQPAPVKEKDKLKERELVPA